MANPQIENGYTTTANELYEAFLKVSMPNGASRVFGAIVRMTYGYSRKTSKISNSLFHRLTNIDPRHIYRAQEWLLKNNMICCNRPGTGIVTEWWIQKDYEKWNIEGFQAIISKSRTYAIQDRGDLRHTGHQPLTPKAQKPTPFTSDTKTKNKLQKQKEYTIHDLKEEIQTFKQLDWNEHKIKDHFMKIRKLPEAMIDEALGNKF